MIYLLFFITPVILYLKLKDKVNPIEFLKLNNNIKDGLFISILFVIVLIVKRFIVGGEPINLNIGILWVSGSLVGIFEEIPFRGFVLQKLLNHMDFILANLLTTVLFVSIHIPIWILSDVNIVSSIKSIFIVSLILGYLFHEYNSLWVPIMCHSIFNICIWIGLT
ncbi:CPBP family intramembrane metalloprotease (plasmid) [Clostridium estertheticum]|nr:CPBP family intramembrane metalloprotease [Clostridium estertheticum]WLC91197.1 CPBP family intramembrane metalloprotease [Clostridium estertheticum]